MSFPGFSPMGNNCPMVDRQSEGRVIGEGNERGNTEVPLSTLPFCNFGFPVFPLLYIGKLPECVSYD
jgi:hypothetical protein